ncbi:MAG: ribonuclease P [Candidatus Bathyarchaeota archaeon]|nr:MAG: ribonuclease P [Candidatus Bathyarchaeota archaeon]
MTTPSKKIGLERIHKLLELARLTVGQDQELAQRYVAIARRISMAIKARMPREYSSKICRGCKRFIIPGISCRIRLQGQREPHIVVTCGYCGKHNRFPTRNRGAGFYGFKNSKK